MNSVYLALGGNLGDKFLNLEKARIEIEKKIGKIEIKSSLYETEAWGVINQPNYINQVVKINTLLNPDETLTNCLLIEKEIGRERLEHWGARIIDIDILYFNELIKKTEFLTLPHPYIQSRLFVLIPLNEIYSTKIHPVFKLTTSEMLFKCEDKLKVKRIEENLVNFDKKQNHN